MAVEKERQRLQKEVEEAKMDLQDTLEDFLGSGSEGYSEHRGWEEEVVPGKRRLQVDEDGAKMLEYKKPELERQRERSQHSKALSWSQAAGSAQCTKVLSSDVQGVTCGYFISLLYLVNSHEFSANFETLSRQIC